MGQIVEEGAGRTAWIVRSQLLQYRPFKSLHQLPVGLLGFEPVQSKPEKTVEIFEIRIRLGGLLDGLRKISRREDPGVRLSKPGPGMDDPCLPEVVEAGSAGRFPADLALMEQVQMTPHWAAGLCRPFGQGPDHPVVAGEPDSQEARFPLASEMKQNPFILKRLAQEPTLAEGANREDKRDDSGMGNV